MKTASTLAVGAPTLVEVLIVRSRPLGEDARAVVEGFLKTFQVVVIPFGDEIAADAFLRCGKGRHPAALNFGDCLSYTAARHSGLPLLYVGFDSR